MNEQLESKLKKVISTWPKNGVVLTSYLNDTFHVSNSLLGQYKKSKWLTSIGQGAMVMTGDIIHYKGGIYALQSQAGLSIHPGGISALGLLGLAHFVEMKQKKAFVFQYTNEVIPKWFKNYQWEVKLEFHQTAFLPKNKGMTKYSLGEYSIEISNRIRAIMELILIAKEAYDYIEAYEIMEKFNDLDPKAVQELLVSCKSVKVNRVFLYMAKKAEHKWYYKINSTNIKIGKGQRSLVPNGVYNQEFQIMVPKELATQHDNKFI